MKSTSLIRLLRSGPLATRVFACSVAALLASHSVQAADGTWTQLISGGLWSTGVNWAGSMIADGSGSTANFNTLDLTADNTVHLDGDRTLTNLIFGDTATATAGNWILDNNAVSTNNLILAGSTPTLTVNALGTAMTATISAIIEGTAGLTKAGAGTLTLTGVNTYTGGTVVSGGTLSINADSALGGTAGGLTFSANGTLNGTNNGTNAPTLVATRTVTLNSGAIMTLSNSVTGSTGLTISGPVTGAGGVAIFTSGNANNFNLNSTANTFTDSLNSGRDTTLAVNSLADSPTASGNLRFGNGSTRGGIISYGVGAIVPLTLNNRRLELTGTTGGGTLDSSAATANCITVNTDLWVSGVGAKTLTLQGSNTGANTLAGKITDGTGSVIALTKTGTGTWILTGANSYSGTTTITTGSLQLGSGSTTGVLSTNSAIVDNAKFTINRSNAVAQGTDFSAAAITGTGSLTQAGAGTTTLTATNSYTGGTTVAAGTLQLGGASGDVLADAGTVTLSGGTLDLNARNETIGLLSITGNSVLTSTGGNGVLTATNTSTGQGMSATGSLTINSGTLTSGAYIVNNNTLTVGGGTLNVTSELLNGFTSAGAVITLNSGAINADTLSYGNFACTYRLNGGTAQLSQFKHRGTGAVDIFLNGGTLQAKATLTSFMTGLGANQNAWLSSGGVTVDTNGMSIPIGCALQHDPAGTATDGGLSKTGAGTLTLGGYTKAAAGTTTGSPTVTMADTGAILVGQSISGTGIPGNVMVTAITPNVSVTISANATATASITATLGGNTYNGTTTISSGILGIGIPSTATSTTILTGPTGTGDVVLADGVTLAETASRWYAPTVTLLGDVTLSGNIRQSVGFKTLDLAGGTRTLHVNPTSGNLKQTIPGNTALEGTGRSRWEMIDISDAHLFVTNAGTLTVQNGTLALDSNLTGDDYAGFMFQFPSIFAANAGLIVGPNVFFQTSVEGSLGTTTDSTLTAKLTVSGIWTLGASVGAGHTVYSLAGTGKVYASMVATNVTARTLTLNGTAGSTSFSGTLNDGPGTGKLALTKTGASTQILSGINTYTGDTTVSGGILAVTGNSIADSNNLIISGGKVSVTGTEVVGALFYGAVPQTNGTYGSSASAATFKDDSRFAGGGVLQVGPLVVAGYATWAATNAGGQTADQDFDHDGVPNGVEYFMGQTGSSFTANPSVVTAGSVRTVTWPRDPAAVATFLVQISDTLAVGGWTDIVPPNAAINETNPNQVTYTLPTGAAKKFCRLVVTP